MNTSTSTSRPGRFRTSGALLAAGLLAAGTLSACGASKPSAQGPSKTSTTTSSSSPSAKPVTITVESSPVNVLTRSFNPFSTTSASSSVGSNSFIYEPLLQFDAAKAGVIYPWLASKYAFSNGGKTVTFTIRPGVKFSNGTPLTPADVAFTYNLVKKNPAINTAGPTLPTISAYLAPSARGATLSPGANISAAERVLAAAGWVKKAADFEKGGKPLAFTISDPTAYTNYAVGAARDLGHLQPPGHPARGGDGVVRGQRPEDHRPLNPRRSTVGMCSFHSRCSRVPPPPFGSTPLLGTIVTSGQ